MRRTVAAAVGALLATATGAALAPAATGAARSAIPSVTKVGPTSGSTAGGARLTITGSRFARGIAVAFGSAHGSSVRVLSSTRLQVTAPAHAAGSVDVTVHTKGGTSRRHATDRFLFVSPPAVSGVAPNASLSGAGGARVTVTGHGFTAVTGVRFGTAPGTAVKVLSATKLQVTAPAHPSGPYDVQVVSRYGTSRTVAADRTTFTTAFDSDPVVGQDGTLHVNAYGLRPGASADITVDDGALELGSVKVGKDGSARFGAVMSGQVPDGSHALRLASTDGTGAPQVFDASLLLDGTPPVIDDVTVSSATAQPGDTLTFRAHVTDEGGLKVLSISATPGLCRNTAAHLESGTASDGIWAADCTLPANTAAGTYTLDAWGVDVAGNLGLPDGSAPPTEFQV